MKGTVAVFGGSFDPPHLGHTLAAAYVLTGYRVDQLVVVPTAQHPFDKDLSPFHHRLRMCQLAMARLRDVSVSDIEASLGGESRTLRTLQALKVRWPDVQLRLVLGSDLVPETPHWHNFPAIERLAPPLVVQRSGHETAPDAPALPMVSSTEVRQRARTDASLEGLVCPTVADYIAEHGLYRSAEQQQQ